jgi:hypothetical protein
MNWLANLLKAFSRGLAMLSPDCRQVSRLQSDALDRDLPFLQRLGLRLHLFLCKWCRRYGKQVRFLRHAAHDHPERMVEPQPRKMSDEARERIKQRLKAEPE